jgi:predicted Zn-dependent protease with MMP-like domain
MSATLNHTGVVRQASRARGHVLGTSDAPKRMLWFGPRRYGRRVRDDRHARHRRADADRRRRPVDGFRARDPRRFARLVEDALAVLPAPLLAHLDGVQLEVAELPPPDPAGEGHDEVLLGIYEPAPTARRSARPTALAGRLTLFRRPIEARATSKADLADIVRETVVLEIAHHLGIDDDRLDELGWG